MFGTIAKWMRYRGVRVITCPENLQPAAVRVDVPSLDPGLHLRSCSRWPEMAGCDEACVRQIETSPEACAVRSIVTSWYDGKACHFCAKPIGSIVWHERPPAVRLRSGATAEWKELAPEQLPVVFATAKAVCWACHVVETFRRERPDLIVERVRPSEKPKTLPPSVAVY
jgi:hypothetical protein